jgi:hypothetical protein
MKVLKTKNGIIIPKAAYKNLEHAFQMCPSCKMLFRRHWLTVYLVLEKSAANRADLQGWLHICMSNSHLVI